MFWDRFILTLDSGGGALVRADPVSGESDKLWQVGRVDEWHEVLPCPIWAVHSLALDLPRPALTTLAHPSVRR